MKLIDGVKLRSVTFPHDQNGDGGHYVTFREGEQSKPWHVESITVECQAGQCGMVPWAAVVIRTGATVLLNLAQCEELEIL